MTKKNSYHIVSLGCAKNTVDSESIATILNLAGYSPMVEPDRAEFVIVNTCGFIQPARQESFHVLLDLAAQKRKGQYLIAAGCLSEKLGQNLGEAVPKLDGILGTRRWMDILLVIQAIRNVEYKTKPYFHVPTEILDYEHDFSIPQVAVQGASSYLKIADGCRHRCAFCAIPLIKGLQRSRPEEMILLDAITLQKQGVKEINIIAQDTTDYGFDLGLKDGISNLLEKMIAAVPQVPWLRILYAYPGNLTDHFIEIMARNQQVLPYLDLPLQHAHPDILRRMQRPANIDRTYKTLKEVRKIIPAIALRTTFIVGFPGETEDEFQNLMDFVEEIKFDHLGAFAYSFEEGTPAEPLGDPIQEDVKNNRLERLMLLQEKISAGKVSQLVGKNVSVLIEGSNKGIAIGRTYRDAPEVDGLVFIDRELPVGEIVNAKVTSAMVHDLLATVVT